jgi:hypothetical protein
MDQLLRDLDEIADRWENRLDFLFWTRALTDTENPVGDSGYDVGWAIGTGGNVDYVPPDFRGATFTSTHTHYEYVNSSGDDDHATLLNAMAEELRHHGHDSRLTCFVSASDLASYQALSKFVTLTPFQVGSGGTAVMMYDNDEMNGTPGERFGFFHSNMGLIELRYHYRIPTGYAWMTRSYGVDNRRNGIAWYEEPGVGWGLIVDPQLSRSISPKLDSVMFDATLGTSVNDRTNGVAGYIADGASEYTNPTIS